MDICLHKWSCEFVLIMSKYDMVRYHQAEQKLKWWDMPEEKLKEHIALFQKENVTVEELDKLL